MAINGTTGNDTLTGTKGADTIYGLGGNDSITGDDGNDYLDGGAGNDTLDGGVGNDSLTGGAGNDLIYGGAGDDKINYVDESGDDTVYGGDGNDLVSFTSLTGNKVIFGESGDDSLYGGVGNDSIDGGTGNDYLDGGSGNDTLDGGVGNDSLTGGAGNDLIYGGAGDDKINYLNETGNDTVYGGDGNDLVSFTSLIGDKVIFGESGNDTLDGGIGNDSIDGGIGNDILTGGDGNDTLIGGEGNNSLYGNSGNDSLTAGIGNDYLDGGDGDDYLNGGDGADSIYGGIGNDTYLGGEGNDYLYDSGGNNYFDGGGGNDTVYGDSGNDTVIAGDGNDKVYAYAGSDSIEGGNGDDYLTKYLQNGNGWLSGGEGGDTILGGNGNDTIDGGAGDDTWLEGYIGNDLISGGDGNDKLYGDEGDDTLDGGGGADSLLGGLGNDTYYVDNLFDYIEDDGGSDTAIVSKSFVKLPSTIENVRYINGAQALPYWIDALLPDNSAGLSYLSLLGGSQTFNYTFPTSIPAYDTSASHAVGWTTFSSVQQSRVKAALTYISSVVGLSFSQTSVANSPNTISFANNTQSDSAGYAQYPNSTSLGSDLFLNNSSASPENAMLKDGSYGALTLIHEIGHTLGLEHPGNYNAGGGGTDSPYLSGVEDSTTWTVMSYTDYPAQYYLQFSPLDIAALQYLYGPSATARATDDSYQIQTNNSNFIWDGAGNDTITLVSVNQGSTIYLTPGYWGYVGAKSSQITAAGQITVNFGTIIERLLGSSYSDSLYGNEVNNTIDGGAGNDLIEGWAGNDSLSGGLGNDTLNGGVGNDYLDGGEGADVAIFTGKFADYKIQYDSISGRYTFSDGIGVDGTDTLNNVETVQFSDKSITLSSLDFTPPTIALTTNKALLGGGQTATLTFTLSEPSTNFIASDVTVSGGTLSNFTGSGTSYTATFTPTANSTTSAVVSVASGAFTDAAGNANADGSDANNTVTFSVDTLVPTIAVSSTKSSLIAGDTATLTFTLSEPSTNFVASDVTVSGGTLSNFTGSGTSYTATLTPTANSTTNAVVSIASGVFTDAAGNANADGSDANNRVTISIDTVAPTVLITDNVAGIATTATKVVAYSLIFSEAVTGLDSTGLTVTNGTISSIVGSGANWTVNVTPAQQVTGGAISLTLKAGAVKDAAGNANALASNSAQTIDTSPPVAPKLIGSASFNNVINPQITMQTSLGAVVLELYPGNAPATVANMLAYANSGFFDATTFHRVIPGFMVQGGGFNTALAYKTPTYGPITLESDNGLSNVRGTIAMARTSDPNSANTQFFINQVDNTFLNYVNPASPGYAVFGKVVSGISVVDAIANVTTATYSTPLGTFQNVPVTEVVITSIKQTVAGSIYSNTATLSIGDLEAGAQWSFSLNGGLTWAIGSGDKLTIPVGSYAVDAIQIRQTDAAGNLSAGVGKLTSSLVVGSAAPPGKAISGTTGNDFIVGTTGNDTIDGGAGIDTMTFSGVKVNYKVTQTGGAATVNSNADGSDSLINVERLKFTDGNLALDLGVNQSSGQTVLLLGAILPGKLALDASKQALLGSVIGLFDSGFSMADLSGALLRLDIWSILTGQSVKPASRTLAEDTAIVKYLLGNVYGLVPDDVTVRANADVMHSEAFQGDWLAQLALSSAGQNHIGLVGLANTGIAYG